MSYQAYELIPGTSVIKSVEAHCRHLTSGGTFSVSSTPALERVEQWITEGYYGIQAMLAKEGYNVTIPASATPAIGFLEKLNVYAAVAQVELAHPITGRGGQPNDRYIEYLNQYEEGITLLASDALAAMGAERSTNLGAYVEVGGISKSRKRTVYEDSDAVQSRFKRNFGRSPLVVDPYVADGGTAV